MAAIRLFFATDIHGSEVCYRKFLAARSFYSADVMILGGDITGKTIVPVVTTANGFRAHLFGQEYRLRSSGEVKVFEERARNTGAYTVRLTQEELAELASDSKKLRAVELRLIEERLDRWISLAKAKGYPIYFCPGNDDDPTFDALFQSAEPFVWIDRKSREIEGKLRILGFGGSNRTPWGTPREFDETEICLELSRLASENREPDRTICSIHVPPFDSGLDLCPELDSSLQIRTAPGFVRKKPVGSESVRKFIHAFHPLLALFGHVHESRGTLSIGRTLCVNPGSTFHEGTLAGVVVAVEGNSIRDAQFTSG